MNKHLPAWKRIFLWGVLATLLAGALFNQYSFSLKPLYLSRGHAAAMMAKNDLQKLETVAPDLFNLIRAVNAFPASTRFYFVPCFNDSGNTGRWWWYIHLITRYFSYPRHIFSHDKVQYDGTKEVYIARFIGQAKTWRELDWITSRDIEVLILMRNDSIKFMRTTDPVESL